jgi:anti-anti-sigma regulatory factor
MVLITANKSLRLLLMNYVGRVSPADLVSVREDLKAMLADLPPGFRLLADLTQLEFMDPDCAAEMGLAMDMFDERGVSLILRVIPDSSKDIGLSILSVFHYAHQPRTVTCDCLAEALKQLALWP